MPNDFQELVDNCHHMSEELLVSQDGEFYPFGAQIDVMGEFAFMHYSDGDEFPLSQTKIDNLRNYFDKEIRLNKIRSYSIAFDCLVKTEKLSEKTDAIAIECVSVISNQKTVYYFPYVMASSNEVSFGESWAENI